MGTLMLDARSAARSLLLSRWVHLPGAVTYGTVETLGNSFRVGADMGETPTGVWQRGRIAVSELRRADGHVRTIAEELGNVLAKGFSLHEERPPARFNEVTWSFYPNVDDGISAHRDHVRYGGVIAVITLEGLAQFQILRRRRPDIVAAGCLLRPGSLTLMLGADFPRVGDRCRLHSVRNEGNSARRVVAFRFDAKLVSG